MIDYQKVLQLLNSTTEVYKAITQHIPDWWSNDFSGHSDRAGEAFDIAFGNTRKTFAILTALPNEQIVWECKKAYIDMATLKNKEEWVGTSIVWTLQEDGTGTTLTFLHEGLNSAFECYEVCEAGWEQFLNSLKNYLTTGTGSPYLKKQIAI